MNMNPFGYIKARRGFLFTLLLSIAAGFSALPKLRVFADPSGLNGYFYLKQTKTLATLHSFYFSDHSLSFAPLVLLRWITGSELLAFQLGICLSLALAFAGVLFLVDAARFSAKEAWIAKVALLIALFSSSFFSEFSLSFYKNSAALGLVLCAANFCVRRRFLGAALFFLAAFLTHKSVALLGLIFLALFVGQRSLGFYRRRGITRLELRWLVAVAAVLLAFSFLFLYHFPKAQAFVGFALRSFREPSLRIRWYSQLIELKPSRALEIGAWLLLMAGTLGAWRKIPSAWRLPVGTVLIFAFIALHPFQPGGPASLGYRLTLMMPLLAPILAFGLTFALPRGWRMAGPLLLLGASALTFSPFGFREKAVKREVRPYSRLLSRAMEIKKFVRPEDHLVSHHGLEFYVDYITDIRSRSFLASPDFAGRKFRVVFAPRDSLATAEDRDDLAQETLADLGGGYLLMEEADWELFLAQHAVPYSWKNAIGERPAHVYE
ncbi:MAG: hypothetical protein EOP11_00865 [Proteobacteria bacterium]|nr:MAG: hypothetical protein EOP11_00865 [Pseudomonadota bacterium]